MGRASSPKDACTTRHPQRPCGETRRVVAPALPICSSQRRSRRVELSRSPCRLRPVQTMDSQWEFEPLLAERLDKARQLLTEDEAYRGDSGLKVLGLLGAGDCRPSPAAPPGPSSATAPPTSRPLPYPSPAALSGGHGRHSNPAPHRPGRHRPATPRPVAAGAANGACFGQRAGPTQNMMSCLQPLLLHCADTGSSS